MAATTNTYKYRAPLPPSSGAYCLSVYPNGNAGGVIGGSALMGHDAIFDLTPGAPVSRLMMGGERTGASSDTPVFPRIPPQRLGWAPSRCVAHGANGSSFVPPPGPSDGLPPLTQTSLLTAAAGAALLLAALLVCCCRCFPGHCELRCWRLRARFEPLSSSESDAAPSVESAASAAADEEEEEGARLKGRGRRGLRGPPAPPPPQVAVDGAVATTLP